jgi:hypothetical protein
MTSSKTTAQAASNGGDTTEKSMPAQRMHGMDQLRQEECYRLTGLIGDGLRETECLVREVHNKCHEWVMDYDGTQGTKPLDRDEASKILHEAYACASLALSYIYSAATHLQDTPEPIDDPWAKESPF